MTIKQFKYLSGDIEKRELASFTILTDDVALENCRLIYNEGAFFLQVPKNCFLRKEKADSLANDVKKRWEKRKENKENSDGCKESRKGQYK